MNHIYRSIWSESLATWVAVPENTSSKGKRSSVRNAVLATGLMVCSSVSWGLPTGQQVVSGQVSVTSPSATQMQITQGTQNAIVNWNGFSIAPNEAVNILQPNISAMLLNRVVGIDASIIQGQLSANGQIFLINPNGILFSNTAQVDVGGLIASTHNISNADFLNGNYHFTQDGATGTVSNQGYIKTPAGGVVALIGTQVSNSGTIATPQGTTALAAGKTVDLDFKGNGLIEVNVPEAALNAQVNNSGAILADGGLVVLTAKAAGDLVSTVLGTDGLIQARSLTSRNGEIILDGGSSGVVQVNGTLDVSGENAGGKINVTGKDININSSAKLSAQATNSGTAGTINVLGDMASGTLNVAGKLDASASGTANGGFIETSAAHVKVADTAKVSTLASSGNSGTWLIDPVDFTIGVDMTGAAVSSALLGGNFTVQSTTGNVNVNDVVNWSANLLTLNAYNNININANMNATNTASLALNFGLGAAAAGNTSNITTSNGAAVNLPAGTTNFTTKQGYNGAVKNYTVITSLDNGNANLDISAATLQGMQGNPNLNYALGANIDASATSSWSSGAGFLPINGFSGTFDGAGHTITGLTIYRPDDDNVGLFGITSSTSIIRNVGLVGGSVTGSNYVGGLAGKNYGSISNSYFEGAVAGNSNIGGLVGWNFGSINNSYSTAAVNKPDSSASNVGGLVGANYGSITISSATGDVYGANYVGGLVGSNYDNISNSFAKGNVVGNSHVGGLAGGNYGSISNTYATIGMVTGSSYVGGLVGANQGNISDVYATGTVSGSSYVGGLAGDNFRGATINSACSTGDVVSGTKNVGGLVGGNYGNIANVYATGDVTTGSSLANNVGGLVGANYGGIISNAYATGDVTSSYGSNNVGGLVGGNYGGSIFNAYATGHVTGFYDVGGLVGGNYGGTISNVYAIGRVDGYAWVGGLVGYTDGGSSITNSYATGDARGYYDVGGLVGLNYGSITNSYATGYVYGNYGVGGLVGYNSGSISNSYAAGYVYGYGYGEGDIFYSQVGGLVGASNGSISNSFAIGNVYGYGQVGGLVGTNYGRGSISNSFATGNATAWSGDGWDGTMAGGLVGSNFGSITNAYATGSVNGSLNVGGLVGYNKSGSSIQNTYATGNVSGSNFVGGLVGEDYSSNITNSFWDMQTTGQNIGVDVGSNAGVTGKTTAEMMQMPTFSNAGWDISNVGGSSAIWRIYEGSTAPLLRSFLTPLTVYFDGTNTYSNGDPAHLFGFGLDLYSDQQGYDISFVTVPSLGNQTTSIQSITPPNPPPNPGTDSKQSIQDATEDFHNAPSSPGLPCNSASKDCNKRAVIEPILKVKNTAGRVERLQMSANKQFVSLLMEDGSVRVWDFNRGLQRQMVAANKKQALTDISAVDDKGELLSISNRRGIVAQDIISALIDERFGLRMEDINSFITSADGRLLLVSLKSGEIMLWRNGSSSQSSRQSDANNNPASTEENEEISETRAPVNNLTPAEHEQNKKDAGSSEPAAVFTPANNGQNQKIWKMSYQRGSVNSLTMTKDKRYGAILSRQPGVYGLAASESKFKPVIDAVDIIDLATGKIVKSLPNQGEYIIYMEFKDNDTLQIGLASGEVLDWSIATGEQKMVANFAEHVVAVDTDAAHDTFAFVLQDGTVRVGDDKNNIHLSIQNKENPFKYAKLLADGKKVLTVLASGDLSLWDVATGRKIARLFSMQNGWTVMDAFGRFDGSEEAIENFSWLANEDDIPLDKFSENYYEPGLLTSLLQNQDYIHEDLGMVQNGITLPPKLNLQLAEQQSKDDNVALQLDVYDRGGGIDKINVYHNGKLLNNDNVVVTQDNAADHRLLKINITPNPGKNTVKVVATNDIGIESSRSELSFDGKTKAYSPSLRLLTVGINQYSDPNLNLSYSVADANAIAQTIKNNSKVAASIHLLNEKATKPRILAELKELSRGSQHDELVIYLAGHGIAVGKEWYFLPYETRIQPTVEQIAATGITATELGNIFKDSKIQHILLMVDACYSGASTDAFDKFKNGQQHFTRQLSRSLGITVITATTKNQEAAELQSLGHGLFTYLMTKEMENKEASNSVTAHGVAASIVKTLPAFSKKMLGISQDPAVYTFGSDFMLTDSSKKAAKDKIAGNAKTSVQPKKAN